MVSWSLLTKKIRNTQKYGNGVIDFDVENGVNLKDTIKKGFISFDGNDNSMFTAEKYKEKADGFNQTIKISKEKNEVLSDLEDFLRILRGKHIIPIFFACPTYSEYNRYLEASVIENNYEDIRKLCTKYETAYWNFADSDLFGKADFYNCNHLNKMGAYKFTKILNDSLRTCYARMHGEICVP
jgi:hypothetical protein